MLQEISFTHRSSHHRSKRWFTDSNMDLFIWFEYKVLICFQLSYNKQQQETSLSWHIETGFTHNLVKSTKYHTIHGTRATTLSEGECGLDTATIAREFLQASDQIEVTLADFIFARLVEVPRRLETHSNLATVSKNL